jgi:exosortase
MSQVEERPASERPALKKAVGRKKSKPAARHAEKLPAAKSPVPATLNPVDVQLRLIALCAALAAGLWAYWPTLRLIVQVWNREPDYSHGYLVVPIAALFLWLRKAGFPGWQKPAYVTGLSLLALSMAGRYFGARFYMEFLDGYSIILWVASVVALVGGLKMLWWTLPSIGFLFFMIPLPFGLETMLSYPLQRIATKVSCFILQLLGQPAFPEGNMIFLSDHPPLEVAQACSGLRLFMTMVAVAYGYVVLMPQSWWQKGILCLSVVPVALLANALRIVATGLLMEYTTGEIAHKFSHDFAGLAMIPLAGAMFGLFLWYMSLLIREEEVVEMSALMRDAKV